MALASTYAVSLTGVDGQLVEVQADLSAGLPGLGFTGLADTSVVESRDRIRAAVVNAGVSWPQRRITVALLPADVRKVGSRFDLSVALAVLAGAGEVGADAVRGVAWVAELGLDGGLRGVRGVLPSVLAARRAGLQRVVVAPDNAAEAALVDGVDVRCAESLADIVAWLRGEAPAPDRVRPGEGASPDSDLRDLTDVRGQQAAKRALAVAAAGAHHLCLIGAPGAGKTMLAQRLPGLLPPLDDAAALEVTAVHSVAGALGDDAGLLRRPPWQAPHHTASVASLVGGGSLLARPGAISLAHHGVLFLDEAPEFSAPALEALRQPIEGGEVVLHRSGGAVRYPARFQLVLAANPCPCGGRRNECSCPPAARRRYQQRLSGPLLDRVDVRLHVPAVTHADLLGSVQDPPETTRSVAARVADARAAAAERWAGLPWTTNGAASGTELRQGRWAPPRAVLRPLELALMDGTLSARGFDRVLRLAWSVADLAGHTVPDAADLAEALYFREGHDTAWAA